MRLHAFGRDFAHQQAVARLVPGEEAEVHPVSLVTAACMREFHELHFHEDTTSTCTAASTACRSSSAGQMPSSSLLLFRP
jgi:hypothetical protein